MLTIFRSVVLAILMALPGLSSAQAVAPAEYLVKGFRSAQFGMSADEVRQAIARDFKPAAGAVTEVENPVEKTRIIVLRIPTLDPGPGPAVVSYILGATSHRLVHVNVVWATDATPSEKARDEISAAGVLLNNYFRGQSWLAGKTTGGLPEGPNGIALFIGVDSKNAAVELRLSGVTVTGPNGAGPAPTGPAQLRLSYVGNVTNPDISRIKPNSF